MSIPLQEIDVMKKDAIIDFTGSRNNAILCICKQKVSIIWAHAFWSSKYLPFHKKS